MQVKPSEKTEKKEEKKSNNVGFVERKKNKERNEKQHWNIQALFSVICRVR